jgi:hypothetical protein
MPMGFLPPADRDRLNHFPAQIPDADLRAFFLLWGVTIIGTKTYAKRCDCLE